MAAASDAILDSCTNNPDFAVICSFFEQFGDKTGLLFPPFQDLQQMIENDDEVPYSLVELHVKLMRKLKKTVSFDRWEKAAAKFAHSYSDKDGWDIERFGYKNTSTEVKLRLLKNLLEAQFDGNAKFKNEINQVSCDELRMQPLGKDMQGRRYWHLLDDDCNLRIYREDVDEESWELVSSDKESLVKLIEMLASKKESFSSEETTPELSEENSPNPSEEMKEETEIKQEEPASSESGAKDAEGGKVDMAESSRDDEKHQETECEESEAKRFKLEPTDNATENSATCASEEPILSEAIEGPVLFVKGEGNGADCETGNPGRDPEQETCPPKQRETEANKTSDNTGAEERLKPDTESTEPSEGETTATEECANSSENSSYQPEDVNPIRDKWKDPPPLDSKIQESGDTDGASVSQRNNSTNDSVLTEPDTESCTPLDELSAAGSAASETALPVDASSSVIDGPVETNREPSESIQGQTTSISDATQKAELPCPSSNTTEEIGAEKLECQSIVEEETASSKSGNTEVNESVPTKDQTAAQEPKAIEQTPSQDPDAPESESHVALESSSPSEESANEKIKSVTESEASKESQKESQEEGPTEVVVSDPPTEAREGDADSVAKVTDSELPSAVSIPIAESQEIVPTETEENTCISNEAGDSKTESTPVEEKSDESMAESQSLKMEKDAEEQVLEKSSQMQIDETDRAFMSPVVPESPSQKEISSNQNEEKSNADATQSTEMSSLVSEASPVKEPVDEDKIEQPAMATETQSHEPDRIETMEVNESEQPVKAPETEDKREESTQPDRPETESSDPSPSIPLVMDQAKEIEEPNLETETQTQENTQEVSEVLAEQNAPCVSSSAESISLSSHTPAGEVTSPIETQTAEVSPLVEDTSESSAMPPVVREEGKELEPPRSTETSKAQTPEPSTSLVTESAENSATHSVVSGDAEKIELAESTETCETQTAEPSASVVEETIQTSATHPVVSEEVEKLELAEAATERRTEPQENCEAPTAEPIAPIEAKTSVTHPVVCDEAKQLESVEPRETYEMQRAEPEAPVVAETTEDSAVQPVAPKEVKELEPAETCKIQLTEQTAATVTELTAISISYQTVTEEVKQAEPVKPVETVETTASEALPLVNTEQISETCNNEDSEPETIEIVKEEEREKVESQLESSSTNKGNSNLQNNVEQSAEVPKSEAKDEKPEDSAVLTEEIPKDDDVKVKNCVEQAETVEVAAEKETEAPDKAEDERLATQLTFDYDSSAPVPVVLPLIFKLTEESSPTKRRGRKRGRQNEDEDNAPPPVLRQSSRIAKLREKEDEERRKQEAERLQRLKEEHERREKRRAAREERMKKQEEKQQRRQQKSAKKVDVAYEVSEDESDSSEEEETSRKKGKKGRRKRGKKKKDRPWDSSESSESSSESDDDVLEELEQAEADNEELVFKSDHEFSPESDLDGEEETAAKPVKHARTARQPAGKKRPRSRKPREEEIEEESDEEEEESADGEELDASCQKCGQSDHPEWILLCDRCDIGWHASCLKPPLMVIPEGDWFCPPCDHAVLLERLQERLEAYEFLLKEKEAEIERKRVLEREARLAEEAAKQAMAEQEAEEAQSDENEMSADDANSAAGDVVPDDVEEEESEEESGEDESDENSEESEVDSDENLNKRKQRRAAKQANYSFKDFDDMIKSAIQDEGEEETANPLGKGPRNGDDDDEEEEEESGRRSPRSMRPSGKGEKRISTSDDDSDIVPRVVRKKKPRKLNDLSATEDEDDSDEEFKATSEDFSESEEDDEEASESGDSFVVEDESDDDDVVYVRGGRKGRAASPVARRATRGARKRYAKMESDSESSEEESEYEVASKRKRGNDSWGESSEDSSSDASWGRSKKRRSGGRAKPPPKPKAKAKPPPRKAPAARGRGRGGGRASRADSDDEPFRTKASVKKTKATRPVADDDEGSDRGQRRTTRGKQISYKDLISSGESNDESSKPKPAPKLPLASRRGRGPASGVPLSAAKAPVVEKADAPKENDPRFSGSSLDAELAKAAAAFAEGADNVDEVLPAVDAPEIGLPPLPAVLPQEDVLVKEDAPVAVTSMPVLPPDLQVSRLIQQRPPDIPAALPADLQINRLINSQQGASSAGSSPARHSPMPQQQQRLLRDAPDNRTPPPSQISVDLGAFGHGGVIKQARNQLAPSYPTKGPEGPSSLPSVIRPYPTPVAAAASLSPSVPSGNSPGNPLSIQGLLSSSQGPAPPARPYANTSHMIGHGPFLNHPSYSNPYPGVPPSRSGYMGTPVTPTPRPAYPQMYASSHVPPPHGLPPIHSAYPAHHGAPLRPSAGYQHAGFPQAFAAAAAAAANAEEERRIFRVTQGGPDAFDVQPPGGPLLAKGGAEDMPPAGVPTESEFGGLVSYFSSQHEDFGET